MLADKLRAGTGNGGITFIASASADTGGANAASLTINKPTGTIDGDLMFVMVAGDNGTGGASASYSLPAGWTEVYDAGTGQDLSFVVGYKIASSEGSSYLFDRVGGANAPMSGHIVTYRNATWGAIGNVGAGSGTSRNLSGLTISSQQSLVLASWGARSPTGITFSSPNFSVVTQQTSVLPSTAVLSYFNPPTGTLANQTFTLSSSATHRGILALLNPA